MRRKGQNIKLHTMHWVRDPLGQTSVSLSIGESAPQVVRVDAEVQSGGG